MSPHGEQNWAHAVPRRRRSSEFPIPLPDGARRLPNKTSKAVPARACDSVTALVQAIPFRDRSEPAMCELRRKGAPTAPSLPFLLIFIFRSLFVHWFQREPEFLDHLIFAFSKKFLRSIVNFLLGSSDCKSQQPSTISPNYFIRIFISLCFVHFVDIQDNRTRWRPSWRKRLLPVTPTPIPI